MNTLHIEMSIIVFIFGTVIGSFLNVCIYRIPAKKSIIFPPSSCPDCGYRLQFFDLIPIVSYLLLRGQCRNCKRPISWRYPTVELGTGLIYLALFNEYGITVEFIKFIIYTSLLLVIAFIDLDKMIIPNVISVPGIIIGLSFSAFGTVKDSLIGAAVGFVVIVLIIIISRGGMGWGDAKLLAMIGAFNGWQAVAYSLFLGSLFGSIFGIGLLIVKKIDRKTPIPFGPFLCIGAIIALFINHFTINPFKLF